MTKKRQQISRRDFLRMAGVAGTAVTGSCCRVQAEKIKASRNTQITRLLMLVETLPDLVFQGLWPVLAR